jgi:hypothetical protein
LKTKFKIKPYDYWKRKYGRTTPKQFTIKDEDEEILMGNINNLHKYITEIEINSKLITYFKDPDPFAYVTDYYEKFVTELKEFLKKNPNIKITGYGDKQVKIGLKYIKWNNKEININLL